MRKILFLLLMVLVTMCATAALAEVSLDYSDGWSKDHTMYESEMQNTWWTVVGLEPDVTYRVALFVPMYNGDVAVKYSTVSAENDTFYSGDLTCEPGIYEDITIVITGNGEVFEHTFDWKVQGVDQIFITNRNSGFKDGMYYRGSQNSEGYNDSPLFIPDIPVPNSPRAAGEKIEIVSPTPGETMRGYDGTKSLPITVVFKNKRALLPGVDRSVAYTLTEVSTGEIAAQNKMTVGGSYSPDTGDYLIEPVLQLPQTLNAGEYHLEIEVLDETREMTIVDGAPIYRVLASESLGAATVNFFVVMEESPKEIYAKYRPEGTLGIDLACGVNSEWDDTISYLTLRNSGVLEYQLTGLVPNVTYRVALMGTTATGKSFNAPCDILNLENPSFPIRMRVTIAEKSGIYPDLTLVVAGGGYVTTRTFTCEVQTDNEREEGVALVGEAPLRESEHCFYAISGENYDLWSQLEKEPPESQYVCLLDDGAVLSGFVGCKLPILVFFGTGYEESFSITLTLKDGRTGETLGENTFDLSGASSSACSLVIDLDKTWDFEPGEYTVEISCKEQQSIHRIMLEKEMNPFENLQLSQR